MNVVRDARERKRRHALRRVLAGELQRGDSEMIQVRAFRSELDVRGRDDGSATVGGLLVPWETETRLAKLGGVEIVEKFERDSIATRDDARYLLGHRRDRPVANVAAGTLVIEDRADGRHVRATVDLGDPDAQRLVTKVRRGDYGGQSIGFKPKVEAREEEFDDDGALVRVRYVIREAEMFEASAVTWPAYDTDVQTLAQRERDVAGLLNKLAEQRGARVLPPQLRARIERAKLTLQFNVWHDDDDDAEEEAVA